MSRHIWYLADWPITISKLATELKSKPYGDDTPNGFVLDKLRPDSLHGRYIERIELTEEIIDPFGKSQTFQRIEFRQCKFIASTTGPGLELIDPPRSTQGLISAFISASGYQLVLKPVSLDVMKWVICYRNIRNERQSDSVIDYMQVGGVTLSGGVTSKVVFNGKKDVLGAASEMMDGKSYVVEKTRLRFGEKNKKHIVLTKSGSATITSDNPLLFADQLRAALSEALHKN
jgi:hypothetical protein